jgi:hypothetical protein
LRTQQANNFLKKLKNNYICTKPRHFTFALSQQQTTLIYITMSDKKEDYYVTLGVPKSADQAAIKKVSNHSAYLCNIPIFYIIPIVCILGIQKIGNEMGLFLLLFEFTNFKSQTKRGE